MRTLPVTLAASAALAAAVGALPEAESLRTAALLPSPQASKTHFDGQLVVEFRRGADDGVAQDAIRAGGGARARKSAYGQRYLVDVDAGLSVEQALERFASMPEVDYAERNGVLSASFRPNDQLFPLQWHLPLLDAERTWDIQQGDPSVAVAVLDTGIAYEDFGRFRRAPDWGDTPFLVGFNIYTRDEHANDDNFHGTHVASVVAEATNNQVGGGGLAFRSAIMPVKVLDGDGVGSFFGVAEGIDFVLNAPDRRAKVINLSLGGRQDSEAVRRAVERAHAAGIVVVAAAGNDGESTLSFPARLPLVIAVGALDFRKRRAPYSNFGPDLDVVAFGGDNSRDDNGDGRPDGILQQTFDPRTARREGRFDDFAFFFVQGTSQATPQVAALAALLIRQGITDPEAVRAAIEQTAEDLGTPGRDDTFGHGLIRPSEALKGLGFGR